MALVLCSQHLGLSIAICVDLQKVHRLTFNRTKTLAPEETISLRTTVTIRVSFSPATVVTDSM